MATAIQKTEEGSFIPASQRPDGSWRKPRRVKEGYIPQEEVPLYESKGKQFASKKPTYPVGLDPALIKAHEAAKAAKNNPIPGMVIDTNSGKSKKKKKKKPSDASKEGGKSTETTAANTTSVQDTKLESEKKSNTETNITNTAASNTSSAVTNATTTEPAKRLKNLRKKLREIEAIEKKISSGEIKAPDKDQKEKVSRKPDVLSEIMALELSLQD